MTLVAGLDDESVSITASHLDSAVKAALVVVGLIKRKGRYLTHLLRGFVVGLTKNGARPGYRSTGENSFPPAERRVAREDPGG